MIKRINYILLIISAVFFSCDNVQYETLPKKKETSPKVETSSLDERFLLIRAARFNRSLEGFTENAEIEIESLAAFIDPQTDAISLAFDYYHHWYDNQEKYNGLVSNIVNAEIVSDEVGIITVQEIWELQGTHPLEWVSKTKWVKRMGYWYRSAEKSHLFFEGKEVERKKEEEKYHLNLENY